MGSKELLAEAEALEQKAEHKRKLAYAARLQEGRERPLAERLCYAATARCPCGAGLAYDPFQEDGPSTPFFGPSYWDCSAVILGTARKDVKHTDQLPFAFYEIKSENQPSAGGATTRPKNGQT